MAALPERAVILLLEDSELDAELAEVQLRRAGIEHRIERVWQRSAFEDALRNQTFDLILADFVLPSFDGLSALEIARALAPHTPFIFVSGTLGEETAIDALKRGAVDYVVKQRLDRLPVAVNRALAEAREIKARRTAEEALRESEAQFRLVADSAPALIWMTDVEGRIVFANQQFRTMLGVDPEQVLSGGWTAILAPETARDLEDAMRRSLLSGAPFQSDLRALTAGSSPIWLRFEGRPRYDKAGRLLGLTGASVDVTAAKLGREALEARVEERTAELRAANERLCEEAIQRERSEAGRLSAEKKLHQAQKMETVGQLTGGIAHDFNNLLMVILSALEQLRKRVPSEPKLDRLLDNARQAGQRGAALTQRLLAFSRQQDLEIQAIDIKSLVEGMNDLMTRANGPGIAVDVHLPEGLPPALVDANQLELALLNLVVNARDAMPDGGDLCIELDLTRANEATDLPDGRYVRLTVRDSGTGMDEETLRRAVEPFFSTKDVGKGTGLGLSMIHGFADQLGGTFRLWSKVGQGTRAELWLPVAEHQATEDRKALPLEDTQAEAKSQGRAILVVDDDALVRMGVVDMLEDLGHTVVEASSGREALDILADGQAVDLMITDHSMPGMTGTQLAQAALETRPDLPILLATGYVDLPDGDVLRLPRLSKPYDQNQLSQKIAGLLR